jgi:transcriptional regulator with XRE-family HTH domain
VLLQSEDELQQRTALIGANLQALRHKHGYTLSHVAEIAGISVSHLANVEQGRRSIGGEQLRQILQSFGYSLGVFMTHIESLLAPPNDSSEDQSGGCIVEYRPIRLIGRNAHEPQLLLLHPTRSYEEPEHLLLILPAGRELWHSYLELPCRCSVAVACGALLVETRQREYTLAANNYLALPPGIQHRFRNHTGTEARAYIWVESAWV